MSSSRNISKQHDNENIGLAAIGSAGHWQVAVDETTSGSQKWSVQIEGPLIYLSFEVRSPDVIDEMLEFLAVRRQGEGIPGELVLGGCKEEQVSLIRDDEFSDRYFLLMETENHVVMRLTLAGIDLKSLVNALRDAKEDLKE